jgi:hypothetical protein
MSADFGERIAVAVADIRFALEHADIDKVNKGM